MWTTQNGPIDVEYVVPGGAGGLGRAQRYVAKKQGQKGPLRGHYLASSGNQPSAIEKV